MTTTPMGRRSFLRGAAVAGAVGASGPLSALMQRSAHAQITQEDGLGKSANVLAQDNGGYGPLQPAGPELDLPAGFTYVAFGRTGEPMTDGRPTPSAHDGMATFPAVFQGQRPAAAAAATAKGRTRAGDDGAPGMVTLVRNHERSGAPAYAAPAYDPLAGGGTTTLVFDTNRMELVESYASLAGTIRNCAGGPTPWGSWLSCEETTAGQADGLAKEHGYNFDVPAEATQAVDPVPLIAMGRFSHEAIAVDPATGIVYETEDSGASGFYRFLPNTPGVLADGGRLQMLAVRGRPQFDTRTDQRQSRRPMAVEWVDIDDPDPSRSAPRVYAQGFAKGGATFSRLEGAWYGSGSVYFTATSGGDASRGQVWEYRPGPGGRDAGRLALLFESPGQDVLDYPDNITVTPSGSVLLFEDGGGEQFMRGVNRRGQIFDFGRNALNNSELAGGCFSPDGSTLFVNIQSPGISFAIQGPWERGQL